MRIFLVLMLAVFFSTCRTSEPANRPNANVINNNNAVNANQSANISKQPDGRVPVYTFQVVNTFRHDPKAFTEGLFFHNGFLYESTGEKGASSLRKVELESGKVVQKFDLPRDSFGEGIAMFNDKIYQLTWQEGLARVFDANNFQLVKQFNYAGEGWGMTHDAQNLIMSDGTHVIRFVDPETFQTVRTIAVFDEAGKPLMNLNELELIKGELWANIWHSEGINKPNHIARLDPQTGKLLGWINLEGISSDDVERNEENTLNGIAYDEANDRIFVTGKDWKKLFEIKVKPKE